LRVFARPPLAFYLALAGGALVDRQPDLAHLVEPGDSTSWALLDMAMIRQDNVREVELNRSLAGWVVEREVPTTLNPPTLLDIDPSAARERKFDASAVLRLLRPKRIGDVR